MVCWNFLGLRQTDYAPPSLILVLTVFFFLEYRTAANGTVGTTASATYSAPAQYTGAAVTNVVSGAAVGIVGLFAVLFL